MMPSIYSGIELFSECTRDAAGIQNCPRSLPFSMPTWLRGHRLGMCGAVLAIRSVEGLVNSRIMVPQLPRERGRMRLACIDHA